MIVNRCERPATDFTVCVWLESPRRKWLQKGAAVLDPLLRNAFGLKGSRKLIAFAFKAGHLFFEVYYAFFERHALVAGELKVPQKDVS